MIKSIGMTMVALMLLAVAGCGPTGPDIPGQPTGLTVTSTSPVTLSWNAVPDVDSYNLYRGTVSGGIAAKTLLVSNIAVATCADTSTVSGTTYYYQVTSVNSLGESAPSDEASVAAR